MIVLTLNTFVGKRNTKMGGRTKIYLGCIFIFLALDFVYGHVKCKKRFTDSGFLCVCNSEYCDTRPETNKLPKGHVHRISTAKTLPGFNADIIKFTEKPKQLDDEVAFIVDRKQKYQEIKGFGGSLTDSVGINILSLSEKCQNQLLRAYFGKDGIRYNLCRVPLGGTDFSIRDYTYDDVKGDIHLKYFNLTEEDYKYKIPIIKRANSTSYKNLELFTSNWAPPVWMKTHPDLPASYLKEKYYQLYTDYQIRFLEEYKKEGIDFWGITAVNEPLTGIAIHFTLKNLIMFPEHQRKWIGHFLGPSLKSKGFGNIKIMTLDDQRKYVTWWMDTLMEDKEAAKFTSGIALHWYFDFFASPKMMDETHSKYPDKFILYTESSINKALTNLVVNLGSWDRGALYAHNIIQNLNHWTVGWVDWNLALDTKGGPNYNGGQCDSSVLVNSTVDEFYKQPMFYAIGHFSAFTASGSVRIKMTKVDLNITEYVSKVPDWPIPHDPVPLNIPPGVYGTATGNVDGSTTVFLLNGNHQETNVKIIDKRKGVLQTTLKADSMNSFIYW